MILRPSLHLYILIKETIVTKYTGMFCQTLKYLIVQHLMLTDRSRSSFLIINGILGNVDEKKVTF